MNGTALKGTLVVELGGRIAAGVCGSILAQLGAKVVLVEIPVIKTFHDSKWQNRDQVALGKLSFLPKYTTDADLVLLHRLIKSSDAVLISSDIDDDIEKRLPPRLKEGRVVCDITAYGMSAQSESVADTELQVQAVSGIIDTTGSPKDQPIPIMLPIVEFMTGIYAASATIAALRVKRQSKIGQVIDMALYDCAFASQTTFLTNVLTGKTCSVNRIGNHHAMISPWNVFRAKDGWILICAGSDIQWQRLCKIMGHPELGTDKRYFRMLDRIAKVDEIDRLIQSWTTSLTVADCITRLSNEAIACGPIIEIKDYPSEPNLEYRSMIKSVFNPVSGRNVFVPNSPLRMSASPGRIPDRLQMPDADRDEIISIVTKQEGVSFSNKTVPSGSTSARLPLAGIRIIEIGHYTTVPLSTKYLAGLGAEVIKIEPPEGEATRDWQPMQDGQGYFFTYMNSDKRSMMLDLRTDHGVSVLRQLIKISDVLIENLKPGALAKRGFGPADIACLNPRIIYCSVSGFGVHSIYPGRPAFDTVIQAMSGVMDVIRCDGVPMKSGISSADHLGSAMAVVAVLAALEYRDCVGVGQIIDLSMQDIAAWMTQFAWNGQKEGRAPVSVICCSDGYVVAEATDLLLTSELQGVILMDLLRIRTTISRNELVTKLATCGITSAPILTVPEMVSHPRTKLRRLWFTVDKNGKKWPLLASPLRLLGTPPIVQFPMPTLGRDNAAILNMVSNKKQDSVMSTRSFGTHQ